ncbi:MAG: methionine--tRNA ligase [Hadesarchaea archaeon]|nr:MAG: methionine--tRNA ligase [Hadesarchaea archaeon]
MTEPKFFITTAIDYPTSSPHLGHAYEKICADVIARFWRLKGARVHFSTGTDEHGLKIQRTAERMGKTPQQLVDEMSSQFRRMCEELGISYDDFIRTTEERHLAVVRELVGKLEEKGEIYRGRYEGFYCTECETYYSKEELVEGNCPVHGVRTEWVSEEGFFFRMSKYQERILEHLKRHPEFLQPESRRNEILRRLEAPLRDLCISRSGFSWGIPLPMEERYVLYVWVDALMNYLTTAGYPGPEFSRRWPPDLHLIGKDISWHHSVIWTSLLMALDLPLPRRIFVHGFITYRGEKLSKSKGITLDPLYFSRTYSPDALRYFLLREVSFGQDGSFSEEGLRTRLKEELIGTLGNLVHRVLTFTWNHFGGRVPEGAVDPQLEGEVASCAREVEKLLEEFRLHQALERVMMLAKAGNEYFQSKKPWEALKGRREEAAGCLFNCLNLVKALSVLLQPFLPFTSGKIAGMLKVEIRGWEQAKSFDLRPGHPIEKPQVLFRMVEPPVSPPPPLRAEDFERVDLRVAEVVEAERVPGSEKMLRLKLRLPEGMRTVMAGIGRSYTPEELVGRRVVLVANLEKKKILGVESEGMILAAGEREEGLSLIVPDRPVEPGTRVR